MSTRVRAGAPLEVTCQLSPEGGMGANTEERIPGRGNSVTGV